LTVTVSDDEIATLAADDVDVPIGRLTSLAVRFEVGRGVQRAMETLRRGYAV